MGLLSGIGKAVKSVVGGITGGDLLSAGANILGGVMTNNAAANSARDANSMSWEQYGQRHQVEVADLKAAGLNPILSAGNAGSSPTASPAPVVDPLRNVANSALNNRLLRAQIANVEAQTAKTQSDTVNSERFNPLGKFVNQAGSNVLSALDSLPNIPAAVREQLSSLTSHSAKTAKEPLRIVVRPIHSARASQRPDNRKLGPPRPGDYIPMPPKL